MTDTEFTTDRDDANIYWVQTDDGDSAVTCPAMGLAICSQCDAYVSLDDLSDHFATCPTTPPDPPMPDPIPTDQPFRDLLEQLYEAMCDLHTSLDADAAYLAKRDHGSDIVFEFHHDHPDETEAHD